MYDQIPMDGDRWRVPLIFVTGFVLAGSLAFLVVRPDRHAHTISGVLVLAESHPFKASGKSFCTGVDGYSDIATGTTVTVRDENNRVIGVGDLETGEPDTRAPRRCQFAFRVNGVRDARVYQIEVSHRGALSFTRKRLQQEQWTVALSLGS